MEYAPPAEKTTARTFLRALGLVAVWCLVTLPFLSRLWIGATSGDVRWYWQSGEALLAGVVMYRDLPFEYPPYTLAWLAGPAAITSSLPDFRIAFGLLIWTADALIKGALIWIGARSGDRFDWRPVALYTMATAAGGHFLLQRYDMIPAAVSFAALLAFGRGWLALSGALFMLATGTKAYPALFLPVMAVVSWHLGPKSFGRFVGGALAGALPLAALGAWMPWWRFAVQHVERGLGVESIWASSVWLLHFAGLPATWEFARAWTEVRGPAAAALVTPARIVWLAGISASVAVAVRYAWRRRPAARSVGKTLDAADRAEVAMLLLLPAAAMIATNPVLSPQFHLWLLPWCALMLGAEARGRLTPAARHAALCLLLSMVLVPSFYPTRSFATGLDLGRTLCLILRNVLLLYGTIRLWLEVAAGGRAGRPEAHRADRTRAS